MDEGDSLVPDSGTSSYSLQSLNMGSLAHMGIPNVFESILSTCCIDVEMKTKPLLSWDLFSNKSLVGIYFVSAIWNF